jgi:hypothetical protein
MWNRYGWGLGLASLALTASMAAATHAEPSAGDPGSRRLGKAQRFKRANHAATTFKPKSDSLERMLRRARG